MAFTVSILEKTVMGNMRCHMMEVTTDGASEALATGLTLVRAHTISPISMNSGAPLAKVSAGTITLSNCTSGDRFYLTAYGR